MALSNSFINAKLLIIQNMSYALVHITTLDTINLKQKYLLKSIYQYANS